MIPGLLVKYNQHNQSSLRVKKSMEISIKGRGGTRSILCFSKKRCV